MTVVNVPARILLKKSFDINHLESEGSILFDTNESKFLEFRNKNGVRVNSIAGELKQLRSQYYQHDEKGEPVYGEDKKMILFEGKTQEEFHAAYDEIMNRVVPYHK